MKRQTIADITLELEQGKRYMAAVVLYRAQDPFLPDNYIEIKDVASGEVVYSFVALNWDARNQFLAEFNNGLHSWSGRVW